MAESFAFYNATLTTSDATIITASTKMVCAGITLVNASASEAIVEYLKVTNSSDTLKYYILYNKTLTASGGGLESTMTYGLESTDKLVAKLSSGATVTLSITALSGVT